MSRKVAPMFRLKFTLLAVLSIAMAAAAPVAAQTRPDLWMPDRSVGQTQPEPLNRIVTLVGERLGSQYTVSHAARRPSRPGRALHLGAYVRGDTLAVSAVMSSIGPNGALTFHADWIFTCSVARYDLCADHVATHIQTNASFWPNI